MLTVMRLLIAMISASASRAQSSGVDLALLAVHVLELVAPRSLESPHELAAQRLALLRRVAGSAASRGHKLSTAIAARSSSGWPSAMIAASSGRQARDLGQHVPVLVLGVLAQEPQAVGDRALGGGGLVARERSRPSEGQAVSNRLRRRAL